MAVVELESMTKRFAGGGAPAVDDVSLTIEDGEFMVLLGPSGCGKSTTLRMVAGLESISSGSLRIDGELMNRVPAKDRDIAMVFQSYALYPHLTVRDNLAFGLRRRAVDRAQVKRRVEEVAEMLGLTPLLARKPFALSAWLLVGPSCAIRRCSCSMSRCRTSTRRCACAPATSSCGCTGAWVRR